MTEQKPEDGLTLAERLESLERLESELMRKGAALCEKNADLTHALMFVLGAVRRTLAQSSGFRTLIKEKNFSCAAAILRMQLDTAMRVNALRIVENPDDFCRQILDGKRLNTLKDSLGNKLTDAHLRKKLSEYYPWVNGIYEQASDYIHLSGRHFYNSISKLDDDTRIMTLLISGVDPTRPDEVYFEIVNAFFSATKLAATLLLGYFLARSGLLDPREPHHDAEADAAR